MKELLRISRYDYEKVQNIICIGVWWKLYTTMEVDHIFGSKSFGCGWSKESTVTIKSADQKELQEFVL